MKKDLKYLKLNAELDYIDTPMSVLEYIKELEACVTDDANTTEETTVENLPVKIGSTVRVTDDFNSHGFSIGEEVTITEIDTDSQFRKKTDLLFIAVNEAGTGRWISEVEFELVKL